MSQEGLQVYRLRLAPSDGTTGSFALTLRATDGTSQTAAQNITINVNQSNSSKPAALGQAVVIYAGTGGGGAFRLNGNGAGWSQINQGLDNLSVSALDVNNNVIYAGTNGGGAYISRDGGDHWTAVNNNLPSTLGIFSIASSGQKIYASSVYGVYVTENEGGLWKEVSAGLVDPYVTGLAVSGDRLFASTLRRGVFSSRIPP